jgi:hypothetical protein
MFATFHKRNPKRQVQFGWTWPSRMQEVGVGETEMYRSNKWKKNPKEYEDYKHIAESPRLTYCTAGFLREWSNPRKKIPVEGDWVDFEGPMPKHFTILAPLLGVQLRLFRKKKDGALYVPSGDESLYEVRMDRAMLGGARHPETGEAFLFVYTQSAGVHMLITGDKLNVSEDGIVG